MKKLLLTALAVITLSLAGCSPITEGTVVGKHKKDPYTMLMPRPNGNSTSFVPYNVPGKYYLVVEGVTKYGKETKGEIEVTKEAYDRHEIGDHFENILSNRRY